MTDLDQKLRALRLKERWAGDTEAHLELARTAADLALEAAADAADGYPDDQASATIASVIRSLRHRPSGQGGSDE